MLIDANSKWIETYARRFCFLFQKLREKTDATNEDEGFIGSCSRPLHLLFVDTVRDPNPGLDTTI